MLLSARCGIRQTLVMKCLACGSSNVVEGVVSDSNGHAVVFEFAERSLLRRLLGVGHREIVTFACVHCGVIQQRVSFTDEDRARLATFDAPQPSVVDSDL